MKRGIIDLSSVIWTELMGGKDKEFGRTVISEAGKEVFVNSASYGYEKSVAHLIEAMKDIKLVPTQLIFVMEGINSKAERQFLHPGYKAGRDKIPEQYEQFNLCKEQVLQAFLNCGAQVAWQDGGVEADDVIGYLAKNLEGERWVISGDKDLAQVVSFGAHHWRRGQVDKNPFGQGDFDHKYIATWIATVGDSQDKIPGAYLFGETAGMKLVALFGDEGLGMLEDLIKNKQLHRLEEDVHELPELQRIIDSADNVYMSYELGRLRIDKVNTLRRPLSWRVGMVKPKAMCQDERLRQWHGTTKLISLETFKDALEWARKQIELSPFVALDVETSTPDESDEWLQAQDKEDKVVDVFGSELTSLQMTFGPNLQYTVYLPIANVEEPGVTNISVSMVAEFVNTIPRNKITYVHHAAFELPVCYMAWGELWKDDELYHGFLRNVRDTAIGSSYVDENRSRGLKSLSKLLLNYEQTSYEEVTTREYLRSEWNGKGRVVAEWNKQLEVGTGVMGPVMRGTGRFEQVQVEDHYGDLVTVNGAEIMEEVQAEIMEIVEGPAMVRVQHKMNQLKAKEVLGYGADDTICTAALAIHFRTVMELEQTWHVYEEVETYPAYLTALSYVQGKPFSQEEMRQMEKDDEKTYDEAWPVLRDYLMKIGFEGTVCPEFVAPLEPSDIKLAFNAIFHHEISFQYRKLDRISHMLEMLADDWDREGDEHSTMSDRLRLYASFVKVGDVDSINKMVKESFVGEPKLDLASPKQMKALLYDFIKIPVRVINDVTPIERVKDRSLDETIKKFKKKRAGARDIVLNDVDYANLRKKAKTDDTAIDMALAFDKDLIDDSARAALKAIGTMKKVMTRRSLFYKNWRNARHWKDNKIHASFNQCAAVTRRYSSSGPNEQQLPKKGEAVRFRGCYKPHKRNAVVCSIDYVGQELRLAAEVSQDKNMLACYVGDKLKDIHSITAAGAMRLKWGQEQTEKLFALHGADLSRSEEHTYELFIRLKNLGKSDVIGKKADDLRKDSKNVNFGAQNGARAAKLSETLVMPFEDAQLFLDARSAMFPDVDKAAEAAAEEAKRTGYVKTLMGARRHLREAMLSNEKGAADRAARQAWNFQIQGSAAEMTKLGMARMWLRGIFFKYDAQFYGPIHDECVTSVIAEHAVDFIREKHDCMAQPYATMKVPVLGSISIGPDFADQHECGDWFIAENIQKALVDIFKKEEENV